MRQFLVGRWFLIVLALMLAFGFAWPRQLTSFKERWPQSLVVAAVLFLMALPLDARAMWRALRRPGAVTLAVAINLGLLPLVAWPVAAWLGGIDIGFGYGLLIAASVPTTLASAAVWTRRAGGNDSVALLVTMVTNLVCFVVTPMWLRWTTGRNPNLPTDAMIFQLGVVCVLPVFCAQLLRLWRPLGQWAGRQKTALGVISQCGILSIVLVGAISAGNELAKPAADGEAGVPWWGWLAMLVSVVGVHSAMLAAGHLLGGILGISRADRIAVGFAGSQKTQMVGLYLANAYGGLAVLPMLAYHVCQLLVDTLIADRLARTSQSQAAQAVAEPVAPAASAESG
jgi:sodium/bile acid cotransporter 7